MERQNLGINQICTRKVVSVPALFFACSGGGDHMDIPYWVIPASFLLGPENAKSLPGIKKVESRKWMVKQRIFGKRCNLMTGSKNWNSNLWIWTLHSNSNAANVESVAKIRTRSFFLRGIFSRLPRKSGSLRSQS